jgi:hypothetical protein
MFSNAGFPTLTTTTTIGSTVPDALIDSLIISENEDDVISKY